MVRAMQVKSRTVATRDFLEAVVGKDIGAKDSFVAGYNVGYRDGSRQERTVIGRLFKRFLQ
jgi:hypothetical protein